MILDPTGTVGALGRWADQASLGTLAVAAARHAGGAGGARSGDSLADALRRGDRSAVVLPGVRRRRLVSRPSPARPEPARGRAEDRRRKRLALAACRPVVGRAGAVRCVPAGAHRRSALEHSAELLRDAQSNGAIFLALPANGAGAQLDQRTRARCCGRCAAAAKRRTAAARPRQQAEFRTGGGTWPRLGGLRADRWRRARDAAAARASSCCACSARRSSACSTCCWHRRWCSRRRSARAGGRCFAGGRRGCSAAVVSKLVFSFLLGVVLAVLAILDRLAGARLVDAVAADVGLLVGRVHSAATRRSAAPAGAFARAGSSSAHARAGSLAQPGERGARGRRAWGSASARWAKAQARQAGARRAPERKRARVGARAGASAGADEQVDARARERAPRGAGARRTARPRSSARLSGRARASLSAWSASARVALAARRQRAGAPNWRTAERRVRGEIEREQDALSAAQRTRARRRARAAAHGRGAYTPSAATRTSAFSTTRRRCPRRGRAAHGASAATTPALAGLAGYGREEYERLDPRRSARHGLEIDRELALRRELGATARQLADGSDTPRLGRRERRKAAQRVRRAPCAGGCATPGTACRVARRSSPRLDAWSARARGRRRTGPSRTGQRAPDRSSVMRDAHEVAARRKRQLGTGRSVTCTRRRARRGAVTAVAAARRRGSTAAAAASRLARRASPSRPLAVAAVGVLVRRSPASSGIRGRAESGEPRLGARGAGNPAALPAPVRAGRARATGSTGRSSPGSARSSAITVATPTRRARGGSVNAAGAGGPMQFLASTWARYGVDADGSGPPDRWNAADAIFGAANYLRASGAPADYDAAIFAYNHAELVRGRGRGWAARYRATAAPPVRRR